MTKTKLRSVIGENIRTLRILKGISMDELAGELDKSTSFIGLIERGERGTTAHNLLRLSEIFQVDIGEFFKEHSSEGSLNERDSTTLEKKRAKAAAFLSDLSEIEVDFIISCLKGYKKVKLSLVEASKKDDADDDDSDIAEDIR